MTGLRPRFTPLPRSETPEQKRKRNEANAEEFNQWLVDKTREAEDRYEESRSRGERDLSTGRRARRQVRSVPQGAEEW